MAEDSGEVIGGVQIQVGADLSSLDAAFDAAIARAVQDGQSLSDAISAAVKAPDFSAITGAADQVEARWQQLAQEMASALGITLPAPDTSAVTGAMQQVDDVAAAAAQQMSADFSGLSLPAPDTSQITAALDGVEASAKNVGTNFGELGSQLLALGGVSLTVAGFKELASSAMEAADNLTHAQISLKAITGSAEEAERILQGLEQLGQSDGLAMPGLRDAAVNLANLLPEGTDVVNVLAAIADGAAVSGKSIEAASNKFAMIADSGNASVKSLQSLGLTIGDLGDAMASLGVPAEELDKGIKAAFQDLDQSDRVNVLIEAFGRLKGTAEDLANNTFSGLWHQVANQFEADMAQMGQSMLPIAQQAIPLIKDGLQGLFAVATAVAVGIKSTTDALAGFVASVVDSVSGMVKAVGDLATGNFKQALSDLRDGFTNSSVAAKAAWDDITNNVSKGVATVTALFSQVKTSSDGAGDGVKGLTTQFGSLDPVVTNAVVATKAFVDITAQAVTPEQNFANAVAAAQAKVEQLTTSVLHGQQQLGATLDNLRTVQAAYDAGTASLGDLEQAQQSVAKASQSLASAQSSLAKAQQDLDHAFDASGEALAAFKQALFESIETADESKAALQELGIDIGNLGAHAPDMSALNKAIIDLGVNAKSVKPDIEQLTTDIANLAKDPGTSWDQMTVAIGNLDKAIAQVAKTDLPAAVQAYGQLVAILQESDAPFELVQTAAQNYQKSIDALARQSLPAAIAAEQDLISKLQQQPGAYSQIISAQTDLLNKEILWAHETGQDASDYLIALAKIKDKLSGSGSDSVYQAYVDLQKVNADTFKQLDDAFANLIISGGKFGDAMVKVGQAIAKEMIEDVLKLALMPVQNALKELINSLFPAATNAAQITTEGIKGLADASKAAADAANKAASAADNAAKAFDGGTGSGGLAGSIANLATVIGAVAGIIGAIAGVVSAVELAHIESDTGKIEVSTRGALSELINARKDAWDQHNATYDRLGELKNDLDSMKDSLLQLVQLGPGGGVGSSANADLDTIAGTIGTLLAATRDINSSVQALNQTTSPRLDNILGALQVISNDLFQINTSIRELGGSFEQSSQDMAQQIMQGTQSASANARAIAQSVDALNMPIRGVGNITADTITAAANAANANAAKSLAADLTSEEQLKVLGDEYAFYQRLIDQALRTGNLDLATQYQSAAQAIGRQIATLQEGISHSMQHTDEVYVAGAQNMTAAVGTAGQLITLSVDRSSGAITTSLNNVASTIGSIVAGALGSTGAGGGGGGTITHPVVPSSGAGTGLSTGPYTGAPVTTYNSGTGVTQAGPAPVTHPVVPVYSPTVSGTLGSGNTAPMPHGTAGYATGGYVSEDQVAQVHAGEYVLNPAQVDKLLDAISSGPLTAGGITNPNINPAYETPAQDQTAMAAAVAAQAAEASARMSEQLQLLNQQLSAAIVNAGPNSVQAQELRIQIEALKKQAASTGADAVAAQQKAADQITQALNEIPAAIESAVAASAGPRSLGPPSASGQDGRMASVPMTSISASIQPGGGQPAGQSAQRRALQAAMDWLDKQQGLSDADKAVAQATYASDAANGSLPVRSFGMGGAVTSDMLARLHAGEEVLPPDLAGALRRMVSTPQMGSLSPAAAGVTNSAIQNFTFNVYGPNTEQIVRQIASYVKQVTPAGAVGSTARSH